MAFWTHATKEYVDQLIHIFPICIQSDKASQFAQISFLIATNPCYKMPMQTCRFMQAQTFYIALKISIIQTERYEHTVQNHITPLLKKQSDQSPHFLPSISAFRMQYCIVNQNRSIFMTMMVTGLNVWIF